jgi:chromate reductase
MNHPAPPGFSVGYLVGSLRRGSINRKLSTALVRLAPQALVLTEIPFGNLPLYNQDHEANYPPEAKSFKAAIAAVDAVLFVTPEYNRSIPGGLKNAIDWASRPSGTNAFSRKPSAIIGASPGMLGTAIAQTHLRSIMAFCKSPLMNTVEAYIQFTPGLINDDGEVTNEKTASFLRGYMQELHGFITRVYTALPRAK